MTLAASHLLRGRETLASVFRDSFDHIWRQSRGNSIGLAVSGGVDSMALASLCAACVSERSARPPLVGFIVDHGVRQGSGEEAHKVAEELERMRIKANVLKLDWSEHGEPGMLKNFENIARKLRYRAIGLACRDSGIDSLLVAHHAQDRAETVMARIVNRYFGSGLKGMKAQAALPECESIYGLDQSGLPESPTSNYFASMGLDITPNMQIENGGITIHRPLLPYGKTALIETCRQSNVQWFEDPTNADRTLASRNAIRHLQQGNQLPNALCTTRLLQLAASVDHRSKHIEVAAMEMWKHIEVSLDTRIGRTVFMVDDGLRELTKRDPLAPSIVAELLHKLVSLVSPVRSLSSREMSRFIDFTLEEPREDDQFESIDVAGPSTAGVIITRCSGLTRGDGHRRYAIASAPPIIGSRTTNPVTLFGPGSDSESTTHGWTDWQYWNGRFWLSVCPPQQSGEQQLGVQVRFLTPVGLANLRPTLPAEASKQLEACLGLAPGKLRFTLPAIVQIKAPVSGQNDALATEQIVALPSIGWSTDTWTAGEHGSAAHTTQWLFEIRYKKLL